MSTKHNVKPKGAVGPLLDKDLLLLGVFILLTKIHAKISTLMDKANHLLTIISMLFTKTFWQTLISKEKEECSLHLIPKFQEEVVTIMLGKEMQPFL